MKPRLITALVLVVLVLVASILLLGPDIWHDHGYKEPHEITYP